MNRTYFETVENLATFAVNHPNDSSKFELWDRVEWFWVEPEVAEAWSEDWDAANALFTSNMTDSEMKAYREIMDEVESRRPAKMKVVTWTLREKTQRWSHSRTFDLSTALGEQLDKVWTKVEPYRGAKTLQNSTNGLTLAGMLKRLGKTEVKAQIKDAKAAAEAAQEKARRNYARREAAKTAKQLIELQQKYPEIIWPALLSELVDMPLED